MKNAFILFFSAILIISCATKSVPTKLSYFEQSPDEIVTTPALKKFLQTNKYPKVVLRVNNSKSKITQEENKEYLYTIIEKELMSNGFDVRDRQLFNQITEGSENKANYTNLNKHTDTDLIIELVDENIVPYTTNIYIDPETGEQKTGQYVIDAFGVVIEFKIVMIKNNQFAGSYKFQMPPAPQVYQQGFLGTKDLKILAKVAKNKSKGDPAPVNTFDDSKVNEGFYKEAAKRLINALRN